MNKLILAFIVLITIFVIVLVIMDIPRYYCIENEDVRNLDAVTSGRRSKYDKRVVVTLSTIPNRIGYTRPTLISLLDQRPFPVDEIAIKTKRITKYFLLIIKSIFNYSKSHPTKSQIISAKPIPASV